MLSAYYVTFVLSILSFCVWRAEVGGGVPRLYRTPALFAARLCDTLLRFIRLGCWHPQTFNIRAWLERKAARVFRGRSCTKRPYTHQRSRGFSQSWSRWSRLVMVSAQEATIAPLWDPVSDGYQSNNLTWLCQGQSGSEEVVSLSLAYSLEAANLDLRIMRTTKSCLVSISSEQNI